MVNMHHGEYASFDLLLFCFNRDGRQGCRTDLQAIAMVSRTLFVHCRYAMS